MDSIPLEMDDIFAEYEDEDDINPTRLPDLEDDVEPMRNSDGAGSGQEENEELLAKLKSMKGASKSTVKKPQPKLDGSRLTGERGIPILPKVFKNVKLKGANHEAEDLRVIMRHLEHWGHRLFPKMTFDEVLDRVERLGSKKEVQSCVKRIRLDMNVLPGDEVEEEDNVQRGTQVEATDDAVIRTSNASFEIDEEEIEALIRDQEQPVSDRTHDWAATLPVSATQQTPAQKETLSDEVKARIERNKQLALERRAAKASLSSIADSTDKESSQNKGHNEQTEPITSVVENNLSNSHNVYKEPQDQDTIGE
ncbi:TIMELESS-interacting protein-like [Physella acuta]|uniref:TIMELESS-interacting protein-like n=1 Tax=Physella acuta TaxID=109671 RepID=UPI0027DDF8E5|nr:TIMELESS-interacting protein-like [Physella acuta]